MRLFHIAHHDGLQPKQHMAVCSHPPQGRRRRAKPSSRAQHHVKKLYLQTELPSTFVAHVGFQTPWRRTAPTSQFENISRRWWTCFSHICGGSYKRCRRRQTSGEGLPRDVHAHVHGPTRSSATDCGTPKPPRCQDQRAGLIRQRCGAGARPMMSGSMSSIWSTPTPTRSQAPFTVIPSKSSSRKCDNEPVAGKRGANTAQHDGVGHHRPTCPVLVVSFD